MSVTRVKVSDVSLPSSLVTVYSMTRTVMPGMSLGSAPLAAHLPGGGRVGDPRQVGAVGQYPQHRQVHVAFRAPQHVHPGGKHLFEQPVGQEVAVGQQQVPRAELAQQLAGQRLLPGGQRPRSAAPSTDRVPHSPSPTTRICGNGPRPAPLPG